MAVYKNVPAFVVIAAPNSLKLNFYAYAELACNPLASVDSLVPSVIERMKSDQSRFPLRGDENVVFCTSKRTWRKQETQLFREELEKHNIFTIANPVANQHERLDPYINGHKEDGLGAPVLLIAIVTFTQPQIEGQSSADKSRKRQRVEGEPNDQSSMANNEAPILNTLRFIHSKYWTNEITIKTIHIAASGEDVPDDDCSMESPTSVPYVDLQIDGRRDKLMVRKEYENTYDWLETQAPRLKGAVVCGQPGIGKTLFLYYCLALRLSKGSATLFSLDSSSTIFYLSELGVQSFIANNLRSFPVGTWVLLDAGLNAVPSNDELVNPYSGGNYFIVQATSPDKLCSQTWIKQRGAIKYWMKPWTWDEIWAGLHLQSETMKDPAKLRALFDKYGRSAREIYACCDEVFEAQYDDNVKVAISGADIGLFRSIESAASRAESLWNDAKFSTALHKLFVVQPGEHRFKSARLEVASNYVLGLFTEKFASSKLFDHSDFLGIIIRIFKDMDRSATVRGMLHETACHKFLINHPRHSKTTCKSAELLLMDMVRTGGGGEKNAKLSVSTSADCPQRKLELQKQTPRWFANDSFPKGLKVGNYYVSKATNNASFNSFMVHNEELYIFQISVAKDHNVNVADLDLLYDLRDEVESLNFVCVVPGSEIDDHHLHVPIDCVNRFNFYIAEIAA